VLDSVPELELITYLPHLLDGLLCALISRTPLSWLTSRLENIYQIQQKTFALQQKIATMYRTHGGCGARILEIGLNGSTRTLELGLPFPCACLGSVQSRLEIHEVLLPCAARLLRRRDDRPYVPREQMCATELGYRT